jgi:hypothetical protein
MHITMVRVVHPLERGAYRPEETMSESGAYSTRETKSIRWKMVHITLGRSRPSLGEWSV